MPQPKKNKADDLSDKPLIKQNAAKQIKDQGNDLQPFTRSNKIFKQTNLHIFNKIEES